MIDTTAGLSLARVTIVDESGATVLDEIVRQHVPVLYASSPNPASVRASC
jgi:RNA exonuclease 1